MRFDNAKLLAAIQALTIAAANQTGHRVIHEVRADSHPRGDYFVSEIRIYAKGAAGCELIYRTVAQVEGDGRDEPTGFEEEERTLSAQRDELASWIVAHRKGEAA
ncbi:hypothetical protein M8009_12900 [Halomonas sp. ATCH28]|uniref:Uncharacterized protein n=1 Tax=Halomonas gemina TaxID=2945105 RepID=A0ABT0T2T7_9GAMM|nr:hypothetical protein [Halomonas gemina]MCL7941184.1 hypothetical protein [Halomonas gemina]